MTSSLTTTCADPTGILQEAAKTLFRKSLKLTVESISDERMNDVTLATYEHVVFAVKMTDLADKSKMPPPTLVAQTKKHAERQILRDVSNDHC